MGVRCWIGGEESQPEARICKNRLEYNRERALRGLLEGHYSIHIGYRNSLSAAQVSVPAGVRGSLGFVFCFRGDDFEAEVSS